MDGQAPAAAPPAAPAKPPQPAGMRARGLIQLAAAIKALTMALPAVGAASEEGQGILKALSQLTKVLPQQVDEGLKQAEHQALAPGVTPVMGAQGGQGGPPPGPPGGGGFPQPAPQMLGGGM